MQTGLVTFVAILIGAFAVTPGYGQAQSNTEQFRVPFESVGTPLCGGEEIFFSGTAHFVFHVTTGPDGESVYTFSHLNYQRSSGVTTSGEKYEINEVNNAGARTTQTGLNEFDTVIHGTLVDQGKGINEENTIVQFVIHTVIHPNGEITGEVENVEIKCEGGSDQAFAMDLLGMIS